MYQPNTKGQGTFNASGTLNWLLLLTGYFQCTQQRPISVNSQIQRNVVREKETVLLVVIWSVPDETVAQNPTQGSKSYYNPPRGSSSHF